ncbi:MULTISPECIES: MmgE/PrpD family protein [Limnochorda]|uniref:MmgE/PrpD family protein n=1 Tax=Limnochorda TaxID=1676651 RepID=UPI00181A681A|nr:MmgE/PrpD family protein [Limnochorda pilosa]MBO2487436.1 MmgE/PrpD family protein [Bacillota bacterium]MBO2519787.1 MmgE/PrpD family protein [Bacillota bacterium]NMA70840.1 MmgE/PrpD family protein [Bacillota bacterium]
MPDLSQCLAQYTAGLTFDQIPQEVIAQAKLRVLDSLGCAVAAFDADTSQVARRVARELGGNPQAEVVGEGFRTAADLAAFANGAMIRYLDANDTYLSKEACHPSDNLAAVLAAAQAEGKGGRELLEGLVVSYEILARLADAACIRDRGWDHVTYGAISAAAGAARVLGLDAATTREALALAATPNIALRQTRVGQLSMWKGAAFANAARNGLFAAYLARAGMTGPEEVFDGFRGFIRQVSGPLELPPFGGEGGRFKLLDTDIKHFPAEYHSQAAIEAALTVREQMAADGLEAGAVERVVIRTFKVAVEIIGGEPEKWHPTTRETADHSMPYLVAAALVDGDITPATFTPERVRDPELHALIQRIEVVEAPEFTARYPDWIPTEVAVTAAGRTYTERVEAPLGHHHNPMDQDAVEAKFLSLTGPSLPEERARAFFRAVERLEALNNLEELLAPLRLGV